MQDGYLQACRRPGLSLTFRTWPTNGNACLPCCVAPTNQRQPSKCVFSGRSLCGGALEPLLESFGGALESCASLAAPRCSHQRLLLVSASATYGWSGASHHLDAALPTAARVWVWESSEASADAGGGDGAGAPPCTVTLYDREDRVGAQYAFGPGRFMCTALGDHFVDDAASLVEVRGADCCVVQLSTNRWLDRDGTSRYLGPGNFGVDALVACTAHSTDPRTHSTTPHPTQLESTLVRSRPYWPASLIGLLVRSRVRGRGRIHPTKHRVDLDTILHSLVHYRVYFLCDDLRLHPALFHPVDHVWNGVFVTVIVIVFLVGSHGIKVTARALQRRCDRAVGYNCICDLKPGDPVRSDRLLI